VIDNDAIILVPDAIEAGLNRPGVLDTAAWRVRDRVAYRVRTTEQ
jgi:hypothetical protein